MTFAQTRLQPPWHFRVVLNMAAPADSQNARLLKPVLQAALAGRVAAAPPRLYFSPASEQAPSATPAAQKAGRLPPERPG